MRVLQLVPTLLVAAALAGCSFSYSSDSSSDSSKHSSDSSTSSSDSSAPDHDHADDAKKAETTAKELAPEPVGAAANDETVNDDGEPRRGGWWQRTFG